jgi:HEPN domain-containing protein
VTNESLARSYLKKAADRLDVLNLLLNKGAYSAVVREAQELVELALDGMLRAIGIEPPKLHDVGGLLREHRDRFPEEVRSVLDDLAHISKRLRKERELAFYGDIDSFRRKNTRSKRPAKHIGMPSWSSKRLAG